MDIAQLRYPVAYWDGTPPVHRITCLSLTPPVTRAQRVLSVAERHRRQSIDAQAGVEGSRYGGHSDDETGEGKLEVRQYAITGSATGEIVHWEVHQHDPAPPSPAGSSSSAASTPAAVNGDAASSHPSSSSSASASASPCTYCRSFHPRALLLRQGSARLTCSLRISLGELDTFLVGTAEGFLTLWTATAGRCVKSSLVLPFAPYCLLGWQRDVKVRVGRVLEAGGQERGGKTRMVTRSFVIASSVQSPYVYVVSLPQLKVVKILKHAYEIAAMAVANVQVKRVTGTATAAAAASTGSSPAKPSGAGSSSSSSPAKPVVTSSTSLRALLHCVTVGGTLHRWDLLELTGGEQSSSSLPTAPEDESNREILLTKTKASVIKLPFPSLALPTGVLPSGPTSPASAAHTVAFPSSSSSSSSSCAAAAPYFPVSAALSASGNLLLVALPQHFTVYSILTRLPETPLLPISGIFPSGSLAGCHFLPSFNLAGTLILRAILWTEQGEAAFVSVTTAPGEEGRKRVLLSVLAKFLTGEDGSRAEGQSEQETAASPLTLLLQNGHADDAEQEREATAGRRGSDADARAPQPSALVVDGDRIVAGSAAGELMEWIIPSHLLQHLTVGSYVSPFASLPDPPVVTPSFPSSPASFLLYSLPASSPPPILVYPAHAASVASAFASTAISQRLLLTTSPSDPCTASVLLTEGSGKAVLLARGFRSGLIRVYGPASRSPQSPLGASSRQDSTSALSPTSAASFSATTRPHPVLPDATVIDLTAHNAAVTCLLSIGGREFSCSHAMMASGSRDHSVCIFDVSRATLLKRIRLSYPVASLHKPALTEDDYLYHSAVTAGRSRGDSGLQESRIKEEYQASMENKPFTPPDVVPSRADDAAEAASVSPSLRSRTLSDDSEDASAAGLGVLFIACSDLSLRVYSLRDYSLLQTFRGHDSATLTVFRDHACMREEQCIVQTERHSVYVWSMVDGSLCGLLKGDEGAFPFLQMRGLVAPGSQLSILLHHIRQRFRKQAAGAGQGGEDSRERGDSGGSGGDGGEEEKEAVREEKQERKRDKFHLRSRSTANLHSAANSSTTFNPLSSSSLAPPAAAAPAIPGFASSSSVSAPVHSQHTPSTASLMHPASSFLQSHRPIDRTTQHLLLSSIVRGEVGTGDAGASAAGGGSGAGVEEMSPTQGVSGMVAGAVTPRGGSSTLPKPNLLKRASSIIEGSSRVRGDMARERDEEAGGGSGAGGGGRGGDGRDVSGSDSQHSHDLHIPLVDPFMGTKKLRHTIDVVRIDGKAHLHLCLFIINLNRFIRDLEKRYLHYQRQSAPASPSASASSSPSLSPAYTAQQRPHSPSLHHLAVEALDPTPQEELSYLLSTLFDWDEASPTSAMLRDHFQLHSPFPVPCYAAITDNSQALTVLFPSYCQGWRRWQLDADMTARQALAIAAVCMPLLASVDVTSQTYFSKIVAHYNCLSLDSQLLTERGFLFVDQLKAALQQPHSTLRVACYNAQEQTLEYHPIRMQDVLDQRGEQLQLVSFSTDDGDDANVDLLVTDNHDMFVSHGDSARFAKVRAGKLLPGSDDCGSIRLLAQAAHGVRHPKAADWRQLPLVLPLGFDSGEHVAAFLELYGFCIGSGLQLLDDDCSITVDASERHRAYVAGLLHSLQDVLPTACVCIDAEMSHGLHAEARHLRRLTIRSQRWWRYFASQYGRSSTRLPSLCCDSDSSASWSGDRLSEEQSAVLWPWMLQQLDAGQLRLLLRGLRTAGGVDDSAHSGQLCTVSAGFRDELQLLLLHAGYSCSFTAAHEARTVWRISFTADPVRAMPRLEQRRHVQSLRRDARVWCVTVPQRDQLIVARRALTVRSDGVVASASRPVIVGNSLLPLKLEGYVEPDISVLALFSVNSNEHVQSSARLLLQGVIERASAERRRELSDLWSSFYSYAVRVDPADTTAGSDGREGRSSGLPSSPNGKRKEAVSSSAAGGAGYVTDQEMMTALVLTLIGLTEVNNSRYSRYESDSGAEEQERERREREETIREETLANFDSVAAHICNSLMRVLGWTGAQHDNDVVKCVVAADLLSRSLPLFLPHITRPEAFIHRLYLLSMARQSSLAETAYRCLLEFGKLDPQSFLSSMGKEALSSRNSTHVRQSAFLSISALVKRHSLSLSRYLPSAASVCVQCLDPKEPLVRKTLMNSALAALHALVQQYPLVAMHIATQRFAVAVNAATAGSSSSSSKAQPGALSIHVYDLQRAERIKVLDGHKADVTALSFSSHGSLLASYSATESPPCVKVWSVAEPQQGSGSFLGLSRLMGGGGKADAAGKDCVKSWTLSAVAPPSRANSYYSGVHATIGLKWAEEEDKGFRMRRSRSKPGKSSSFSGGGGLTLAIPDAAGGRMSRSASGSPMHSPQATPPASPGPRKEGAAAGATDGDDAGGEVVVSGLKTALSVSTEEEEDEETVRQQLLKCMLTVKLEWKDDNEVTVVRENGEKRSLSLDKDKEKSTS